MKEHIIELGGWWDKNLKAEDKSPRTRSTYLRHLAEFAEYAETNPEFPDEFTDLRRRHVVDYLASLDAPRPTAPNGLAPASRRQRLAALQQFFKWCEIDGAIPESPVKDITPPKVTAPLVQHLTDAEMRALVDATGGDQRTASILDKRDRALIMFMLDTGIRLQELIDLDVADLDFDVDVANIREGKGGYPRTVPFMPETADALGRYLRARKQHPHDKSPALWIGGKGALGANAVGYMLARRSSQAGIRRVHPHMLRHTFAHHYKARGGPEENLKRIGGWRSDVMLARYGASGADERAIEQHGQFSPVAGLKKDRRT